MNTNQQSFITEYLRTGDKIQAYKNAYNIEGANYHSLESAANRLMRNNEIANTIKGIQDSIRAEVTEELKAELKQELLTIQQKRELLAQIATGQMRVEQNYRGKNCSQCTQYIKPTINQMLKAIDLDNKLAGHYGNLPTGLSKPTRLEKKQQVSQQNTTNSPTPVITTESFPLQIHLKQPHTTQEAPKQQGCFVPRSDERKNMKNRTIHNKPILPLAPTSTKTDTKHYKMTT